MFLNYCLKRVGYGILIFVIIIFIYSIIFNTTLEQTAVSIIEEEIRAELMSASGGKTEEEIHNFIAQRREQKYKRYKLDQPRWRRIVFRALDTLTFRFGKATHIRSASGDDSVWAIVSETIPRTLLLFTTAIFFDLLIGFSLGIIKAQRAGGTLDKTTSAATMIVYGMPAWWLGMLIIMFFAYGLGLFPSGGLHSTPPPTGIVYFFDILYHMALPVFTLVIIGFWGRAFLTRNIMLGILQEDYIMSARARGIPERKVLFGHALRTAAPPITTMAILFLLASVAGNIVFEGIFSWPGLGNLYWISIEQNDIPVLMGCLFVTTGLYVLGLVLLDLTYGFLDPRIKIGGRS